MNALKTFVQLYIFKVLVLKKYANKFSTLKQNFFPREKLKAWTVSIRAQYWLKQVLLIYLYCCLHRDDGICG